MASAGPIGSGWRSGWSSASSCTSATPGTTAACREREPRGTSAPAVSVTSTPPAVPHRERLRWARGPELALLMLSATMLGGTVGYSLIEGWGLWDSFYMTAITVSTVGYREVHPLSRVGEAFTVGLLISGIGTV